MTSVTMADMGVVGTTLAIVAVAGVLGAAWLADKLGDGPFSRGGPPRTFIIHLLLVLVAWSILLSLGDNAAGPLPFLLMIGELILMALLPLSLARTIFGKRGEDATSKLPNKTGVTVSILLGALSSWYLNFLYGATGALLPVTGDLIEYSLAVAVFPALALGTGYLAYRGSRGVF